MQGRLYIAGVFHNPAGLGCSEGEDWIDNDPHIWTTPFTWGICRPDIRRLVCSGDYVFFVLPKHPSYKRNGKVHQLPQMVFAYLKVGEVITHLEAYHRPELRSKRMREKIPNGNIMVNKNGKYNELDGGYHRDKFEEIKTRYVVAAQDKSEKLPIGRIRRLAPTFVSTLNTIFGTDRNTPHGIITRQGRKMSQDQVLELLSWLRN